MLVEHRIKGLWIGITDKLKNKLIGDGNVEHSFWLEMKFMKKLNILLRYFIGITTTTKIIKFTD